MGLHLPGLVRQSGHAAARRADRAAGQAGHPIALGDDYTPVGEVVDERAIVNGCVALLATGGSTNHTPPGRHGRCGRHHADWDDLRPLGGRAAAGARLSERQADVNHFHAAGGLGCVIRELLDAGLMHEDVRTVAGDGLRRYTAEPKLASEDAGLG